MNEIEKKKELRQQAMALPLHPGVYLMKDKSDTVIYVGKAKALKNRVSQYFGSDLNHTEKVRQMVANVDHFDTILADSEFEALVLECSLIKQYSPKYNILLKDDKGYSYIRVGKPPFSKLSEAKQVLNDGAKYIGPYMSSYAVKQAIDEVSKAFGLATCDRKLCYGRKPLKTERPCLNYHIEQCCGPCTGRVREEEYAERVDEALKLLVDGTDSIIKSLEVRMQKAAESLDFEKAAELRDRIVAIKRIGTKQKVVMMAKHEQDVFAIASDLEKTCVQVFRFTSGDFVDKEEFIIDKLEDTEALRREVIQQYYELRDRIPKRVVVDGFVEDKELLEQWLTHKANHKVEILIPQRGEQVKLVAMCARNAAEHLAKMTGKYGNDVSALDDLQKMLGLETYPAYIECYDISHTAGNQAVAGMVVFEHGRPLKKNYKRFTIKKALGGDDPGAMCEVISRRLNELVVHEGEEGFGRKPDIIFLDGGQQQVNAVEPVIRAMELDIPVFGLVKDGKHRTRAISLAKGEIVIQSNRAVFTLLSSIQEEVHRYAIGFHQKTRSKSSISSKVYEIDGVGKKRAELLLRRFGSMKALSNVTEEELLKIKGITKPVAENIVQYFEKKRENQ